ncbi:MAG: hypothetical protein RJQ04_21340 [Longimicrobiales bacterium]
MPSSLRYDLAQFDGKDATVLQDIFRANHPPSDEVLDLLVDVVGDEDVNMQTGASWLLRYYARDGFALAADQVGRLAAHLGAMHDGFGRLHLCQAIGELTIPTEHAEAFAEFFRESAESRNTFLRAWAPHGLFHLALQHDRYMDEARTMVEAALADPAASVRARARKTLAGE